MLLSFYFFSVIPYAFNTGKDGNNIVYNALFISYLVFLIAFFILYIILLIKDPGIKKKASIETVEQKLKFGDNLINYCYKCYILKTKNSKHCIICDKCYDDFDHHCYWINKCVAKKNYKLFHIFLFETFLYLAIILTICIFGFINFNSNSKKDNSICFNFYIINICRQNFVFESILPIKEYINYIYLILNIIMTLIALLFFIPETLLLGLNTMIFCSNYKENKSKAKMTLKNEESLIETPLLKNDSISEINN